MNKITEMPTIIGKLKGFTKHWNPFKSEVFALVEVDSEVINIPIDYRQQKFIQMEHPVNSLVPLTFNENRWQIASTTVVETWQFKDPSSVF